MGRAYAGVVTGFKTQSVRVRQGEFVKPALRSDGCEGDAPPPGAVDGLAKSRGRIRRRIPEGIRGNEPSDPKSARPSPRGVCASAVSVKPPGSQERYTCYLQRFNPLLPLRRDASPTPKTFWQGQTYGGSG
jgi:hypothetical protein